MLNSAIAASINNNLSIGKQVASGSRSSLLMSHIEFTPSENERSLTAQSLQNKYHHLSGTKGSKIGEGDIPFTGQLKGGSSLDQNKNPQVKQQSLMNGNFEKIQSHSQGDGIPSPRLQLYPPGKIYLEWKQVHKIGAGLANLGNTCFMNTVIQCLTYCPPLANCLLHDDDHSSKCKIVGFCMMCELQKHMKRVLDRPGDVIKPLYIYQKLKSIAKHFQFGRQEDAHEFLRYVIDNLWKACLANHEGNVKLDPSSKETTVVNQIFGGYHRSQVICLRCKEKSNTYDHFMDFILDIKQNVSSLEKALEKFIQPELLQNDNAYKCPRCNMKVSAQKRFTVHRAPNVATFQFKRFDYHRMFGGKITKHVAYPEKFDLRPYMSDPKGSCVMYRLNAVLVHLGPSCNSGHYFCYVRNSNGYWYLMDDARVHQVSLNQVLNQQAYVLFYVRILAPSVTYVKKPSAPFFTNHKNTEMIKNGHIGQPCHEIPGTPISRQCHSLKSSPMPSIIRLSSSSSASILPNGVSNNLPRKPSALPLAQNREKVIFGIRRPLPSSSSTSERIVQNSTLMQNGKISTSTSKLSSSRTSRSSNGLVPYTGDSSESSDEEMHEKSNFKKICISRDHATALLTSGALASTGNISSQTPEKCSDKSKAIKPVSSNNDVSLQKEPRTGESKALFGSDHQETGVTDKLTNKTFVERSLSKVQALSNSNSRALDVSGGNSASPAKMKANFSWHITDANLHSPSIASGSSTNSVNSTTDWTVTDQDTGVRIKGEPRVFPGWTVTPTTNDKETSGGELSLHSCEDRNIKEFNASMVKDISSQFHKKISEDSIDKEEPVEFFSADCTEERSTHSTKHFQQSLCLGDSQSTFKGLSSVRLQKAPNSGNTNKEVTINEERVIQSSESVRKILGSDSARSQHDKSDLPFAGEFNKQAVSVKDENSFLKSDKNAEHQDSRKREPTKENKSALKRNLSCIFQGTSEKWESHLSDYGEDSNNTMFKKCKRTDNEREEKREEQFRRREDRMKKKKHKHKEHKHFQKRGDLKSLDFKHCHLKGDDSSEKCEGETLRELEENNDCVIVQKQSGDQENNNFHREQCVESVNQLCKDKSQEKEISRSESLCRKELNDKLNLADGTEGSDSDSSSNSSYEYEWVEKTKETVDAEREKMLTKLIPEVPSKHWDQDINDGFKRSHGINEGKCSSGVHWDGKPKLDTVAELLKMSSRGFGDGVNSWDGGKSHIDREVHRDTQIQREYTDDYDVEYDRGKVKKMKYRYSTSAVQHTFNPFQKVQDLKATGKMYLGQKLSHKYYRHDRNHYSRIHHNYYRWKYDGRQSYRY